MPLTLTIENEASLPDGGPLSVTVKGRRGLDIGRDTHLDWTLPDPSRFISGKHCEIRWQDGYWLHDLSTNGTILNGAPHRMTGPHRLRDGDRIAIGHYVIAVSLTGEEAEAAGPSAASAPPSADELWQVDEPAPPPLDPRELRPREAFRRGPDFLDWAMEAPPSPAPVQAAEPSARGVWDDPDMSWAPPKPPPPAPPPAPVLPDPRRPVWVSGKPQGPWSAEPADAAEGEPTPPDAPPPPRPSDAREQAAPLRPAPPPAPAALPPFSSGADRSDPGILQAFARGAGLGPEALAGREPEALAEMAGALIRQVVEELQILLRGRAEMKLAARSARHTVISAFGNNPLKFSPSAEDALALMFGSPHARYLGAAKALEESFDDLKSHQLRTVAAMQEAVQAIMAELAPEGIEAGVDQDHGLSALIGSRKSRLWDAYTTRYAATASREKLLQTFLQHFAAAYDRLEARQEGGPG